MLLQSIFEVLSKLQQTEKPTHYRMYGSCAISTCDMEVVDDRQNFGLRVLRTGPVVCCGVLMVYIQIPITLYNNTYICWHIPVMNNEISIQIECVGFI